MAQGEFWRDGVCEFTAQAKLSIMVDFAYTTVPGKLRDLLNKIRHVGVPPKISAQWLKNVGFTSSNDTTLLSVLKFIGSADASSVPTAKWTQYRGSDHKRVLGEAIQQGYADLCRHSLVDDLFAA
jgi:hypothetical protein